MLRVAFAQRPWMFRNGIIIVRPQLKNAQMTTALSFGDGFIIRIQNIIHWISIKAEGDSYHLLSRRLELPSYTTSSAMSSLNIDGNSYWILPDGTVYSTFGDTANCTLRTCPVQTTVYGYRPTLPGSATLIALYGLCALIQSFLGVRYRSWFYMAAMDLGCITEILGYASRILYYYNPWSNTGFIMQIGMFTLDNIGYAHDKDSNLR